MGRRPDLSKRDVWKRRLREFERGEESVAAFCDRVGVSVTTFHRWQRTLSASARSGAPAPVARSGGSSSRRAATRKATERHVEAEPRPRERTLRMSFVPVEITPPAVISAPQAENGASAETTCAKALALSSTHVEALLPGGVRLFVPCDRTAIRTVIAALIEGREEEHAC